MSKKEIQKTSIQGNINEGTTLWLDKKEIELTINSSGGSAHAAIGMFDMLMRHSKNHRITSIGVGQIESAAFWPFITGHERHSYRNTRFGFHDATVGGNINRTSSKSFIYWYMSFVLNPLLRRLKKISNKKTSFWESLFDSSEMVFLSAKELKKTGVVTKIL